MKAMVMTAPGAPEVLQLRELETPAIGHPGEMRVRLRAAGVNPVDTKLRARGSYYPERMPAILGCDGAGVVEEVGEGVTRFRPGDEVYFCHGGIGGTQGNYAEYTVIDQEYAAAKPRSLSFAEAAALPLVLITAWESLHERARLTAGQRVLIHAGAGGVGHVAVQLARIAGARIAATVSSEEKALFARSLGADYTCLYREHDFTRGVLEWSDGRGAEVAFDTVGGEVFERTFPAVAVYGDLVTLLQPGAEVNWKVARNRNLRIGLELMLSPMFLDLPGELRRQREILERGAELADRGELTIHLSDTMPLEEAAEAHRRIEAGGMTGKLALCMD